MGFSWGEVSQLCQDRVAFRNVIRGLCPSEEKASGNICNGQGIGGGAREREGERRLEREKKRADF